MKLLQVWQYGLPNAAETGLDDAIATAKQYGFDGLLIKSLDGLDWMSTFDKHPDALSSVAQVQEQASRAHAAGLQYFVWTNPRHDVDVNAEAQLTAQLALACDGVFLDTEPYAQFWNYDAPVGLAAHFMTVLRQDAPNAFIVLQPDPRANALAEIKIQEWIPECSAIAGQHYWPDFGTDPRAELNYAQQLGQQYGKPVYPTLPGNAASSSFPADLIAAFPGFIVWRLGTTAPPVLQLLGGLAVTSPTPAIIEDAVPTRYTANGWVSWEDAAINLQGIADQMGQELTAAQGQLQTTQAQLQTAQSEIAQLQTSQAQSTEITSLQQQLAATTAKISAAKAALA